MSSSDIYESNERPGPNRDGTPQVSRRRSRRSPASFDETVAKDVSKTNRRRRKNTGFRRFQHLMKKPEYSRKFWTITLSAVALILILLLIWDRFLRYPNDDTGFVPRVETTVAG